jgi:hypothetical protein
MKDNEHSKDQTEPVCAPMVRLEATVQHVPGKPQANGAAGADYDQTEPCGFAPLIVLPIDPRSVQNGDSTVS